MAGYGGLGTPAPESYLYTPRRLQSATKLSGQESGLRQWGRTSKRIGMSRCVRRMREDTGLELVGPTNTAWHSQPRGTTRRLHLNRSKLIRKLDTSSIAIFGLAMVLRTVLHSDERSSTNGTRRALAVRDISSKRGMRSKQPRRTNRLTRSSGDVLSRRCIVLQR